MPISQRLVAHSSKPWSIMKLHTLSVSPAARLAFLNGQVTELSVVTKLLTGHFGLPGEYKGFTVYNMSEYLNDGVLRCAYRVSRTSELLYAEADIAAGTLSIQTLEEACEGSPDNETLDQMFDELLIEEEQVA